MVFSREQNQIWAALMERQRAAVADHASRLYLRGAEILALPDQRIPMLDELNREIAPRTGWRVVRTTVRYSDAVPWYTQFAKRHFMVTEYMRGPDELDFTPEPDMFHDIFGHLPFMVLPEYTALQEMFAPAFFSASESQREDIKRLAWYSTEFGLIKEAGDLKIFGAGLMSSAGEIQNVLERNVDIRPFTIENVVGHEKAVWSFNSVLFWFDSLDALKAELRRYFDRLPDREWKAA
jgi:phenylalanine-4-hydroxylase